MSAYPPRAASFIGDKVRRFDRLKLNLAILTILILIYDLVRETIILILILINLLKVSSSSSLHHPRKVYQYIA